jgi:hypothetical protein
MADITTIPVDQAGHVRRFIDMGDGTHAEVTYIPGSMVGQASGHQPLEAITCGSAAVDYSGASLIASGDTVVATLCTVPYQVAIGEATTSAVGVVHGSGEATTRVSYNSAASGANIIHVRTLDTSAVVYCSRLRNV